MPQFGEVQGTFSGGQHAEVENGRIASLGLGGWTIANLPVAMLHLRQLSEDLGVKQIDGCIGTTLFYHFLATLDFPRGELVLRRKDTKIAGQFMRRMRGASEWRSRSGLPATTLWSAGVGRAAAAGAPLCRHRPRGGGRQAGPPGDCKAAGIKLEERQGSRRGRRRRHTEDRALHRRPAVLWPHPRRQCARAFTTGRSRGRTRFGFHLAGMVGHDFFKPYAVTFDFNNMKIFME